MAFTLAVPAELEEEFKKSRFLTRAFALQTIADFDEKLEHLRTNEPATHHCWAWKFGAQYRFNDDGEPTGTAGKPILTAIEGRNCDRIGIIVTRWYGGIQLGTGGLARAYGGGAARCLQQAGLVEIIDMAQCRFHATFSQWPLIESRLAQFQARIDGQDFDAQGVAVMLSVPQSSFDDLAIFLSDVSRGQIDIRAFPV